jgi:hypothetical protein
MHPDAVRMVQDCDLDLVRRGAAFLYVGGPRLQVRSCDPRQAACGVEPECLVIVLDRPVHRIARQSVLRLEGVDPSVLDSAEAALRRNPERAVRIEVEIADDSPSQAVSRIVRRDDAPLFQISHPGSVAEPKPQSAPVRIPAHYSSRDMASQTIPRNPLDNPAADGVSERDVFARPDISCIVSGERMHTIWKPVDRLEAAVLEHDHAGVCRHPDPMPVVLEERLD